VVVAAYSVAVASRYDDVNMAIPGFTAERSLARSNTIYRVHRPYSPLSSRIQPLVDADSTPIDSDEQEEEELMETEAEEIGTEEEEGEEEEIMETAVG